MNHRILTIGTVLAAMLTVSALRAAPLPPGQVDFGAFTPAEGGEFVEVNLPSNLIALAARFIEKQEPDVAKLLEGLKLVRVNVVGLTDKNRGEMEKRVKRVRGELTGKGWERIVTAMQDAQDVGIYLKMDDHSAVQGLAVTVIEGGKQAVFVNIVGDIRPEQLAMLGERLNIDPLKKLGQEAKAEETEK